MSKIQIELTTGASLLVCLSKEEFEKKIEESYKNTPFMELPVMINKEKETIHLNLLNVMSY